MIGQALEEKESTAGVMSTTRAAILIVFRVGGAHGRCAQKGSRCTIARPQDTGVAMWLVRDNKRFLDVVSGDRGPHRGSRCGRALRNLNAESVGAHRVYRPCWCPQATAIVPRQGKVGGLLSTPCS